MKRFTKTKQDGSTRRAAVTIKDVARKAGVAVGTVSRVVNNRPDVNEELRALYRSADVFVYPTAGDTLPLVVLEAMASRCPVVSTTVGGIPFEVTPECGALVPPDDAAAVARAVNAMLADPAARQAMGRAGRARVEQVFRWNHAAQAAVAGYQHLLGQAPAAMPVGVAIA